MNEKFFLKPHQFYKDFFYILIFFVTLSLFIVLIPSVVEGRECGGNTCDPVNPNCGGTFQTQNECCFNNTAVCNWEYSGNPSCEWCGTQYECVYDSKDFTRHVQSCACGCSNGSCLPCSTPTPTPTPPPGEENCYRCSVWGWCELYTVPIGTCNTDCSGCQPTPTPPPNPPPSCTIDLDSNNYQVFMGVRTLAIANVTPTNGSVDKVRFEINPGQAFVDVCDQETGGTCGDSLEDNTASYQAWLSGQGVTTSATLKATGFVSGNGQNSTCEDTANIEVINPQPWFQTIGGDAVAGSGNIVSQIPAQCTLSPLCTPNFILDNPQKHPGVPSAGGQTDFGSGNSSSRGWNAEDSSYLGESVDYEFFERKIPKEVLTNPNFNFSQTPIGGDWLENNGVEYPPNSGYFWLRFWRPGFSSDLTIGTPVFLDNRRLILFVEGDLNIAATINGTRGTSGFYAIVNGNINIDSDVGEPAGSNLDPDIEGVFYAEGAFSTGTRGPDSDEQLFVRGAVSAGSFNLQRDLPINTFNPAEIFEFAPDLVIGWPPYLSGKNVVWREVAP